MVHYQRGATSVKLLITWSQTALPENLAMIAMMEMITKRRTDKPRLSQLHHRARQPIPHRRHLQGQLCHLHKHQSLPANYQRANPDIGLDLRCFVIFMVIVQYCFKCCLCQIKTGSLQIDWIKVTLVVQGQSDWDRHQSLYIGTMACYYNCRVWTYSALPALNYCHGNQDGPQVRGLQYMALISTRVNETGIIIKAQHHQVYLQEKKYGKGAFNSKWFQIFAIMTMFIVTWLPCMMLFLKKTYQLP